MKTQNRSIVLFTYSSLVKTIIFSSLLPALMFWGNVSAADVSANDLTPKELIEVSKNVDDGAGSQVGFGSIVNLNQADANHLSKSLKGIGLKKAQAIVEWRNANGGFVSLEQLLEVKGIGEKTLLANRDRMTL